MDKLSFSLLKKLYRKKYLPYRKFGRIYDKNIYPEQNEYVGSLLSKGYIKSKDLDNLFYGKISHPNAIFEITLKGREYVEQRSLDNFRFWLPLSLSFGLSLAALIVSIISLAIALP